MLFGAGDSPRSKVCACVLSRKQFVANDAVDFRIFCGVAAAGVLPAATLAAMHSESTKMSAASSAVVIGLKCIIECLRYLSSI